MEEKPKTYTLSQLNTAFERHVTKHFGSRYFWVIAEIVNIGEKGGHRYLELADSFNGKVNARARANLWASTYRMITQKIGKDLPNILIAGNKVLFQLKLDFHPIYGLNAIILDIDAAFSHGEIEKEKQATIQQLKKDGLFDLQRGLYLPVLAKRIALIGSPNTSGYRDFLQELFHNPIYTKFKVKEFKATVQGERAVPELIKALKQARRYDVDVIVILRGGGSKMDLHVFNDYELAREIALTEIPVLTGIGHETDEVVADLVCRKQAITPTAVAKFLTVQIGIFSGELREAFSSLRRLVNDQLYAAKEEFANSTKYLGHYSKELIHLSRTELREASHNLRLEFGEMLYAERSFLYQQLHVKVQAAAKAVVEHVRYRLRQEQHLAKDGFMHVIRNESMRIDHLLSRISTDALHLTDSQRNAKLPHLLDQIKVLARHQLHHQNISLQNLDELLELLNPLTLLHKGYTLSTVDGTDLLTHTENLIGKEMKTLTANHLITSTITDKTDKNEH